MSPPAMSCHLKILRTPGLVEEAHDGEDARGRTYRLRPEPFTALRTWVEEVAGYWDSQLASEPKTRLSFEWRGTNFAPNEFTLVEVSFEPSRDGTHVTVRHRDFATFLDDHPVRHGAVGAAFASKMGM